VPPSQLNSLGYLNDLEWLRLLGDAASTHGTAVHAYALLGDHYRLLVTPRDGPSLSATMQALGRRYVSGFNRRHGRTGTLWEGRFRGAPVEATQHFLNCMRFIELCPVLAGMAAQAADFAWSIVLPKRPVSAPNMKSAFSALAGPDHSKGVYRLPEELSICDQMLVAYL
jgi:REP element-mobilizing transposase RayT